MEQADRRFDDILLRLRLALKRAPGMSAHEIEALLSEGSETLEILKWIICVRQRDFLAQAGPMGRA